MMLAKTDVLGVDIGNVIIKGGNEMFSPDFLKAQEMPGAFESIQRLVRERFGSERVFLVSKCGVPMQQKTAQWLEHHDFYNLAGVKRNHVHFCLERHEKAPICQRLGITHFIDDRLEVLSHMVGLSPVMQKLYLFKPREAEVQKHARFLPVVTRVESWDEVVQSLLSQ